MVRGMKFAHMIGLAIFLGSILTFLVISSMISDSNLENFAFGRRIISTGTNILTLPGIWVLAITGILLGYKRYGLKQRFFQLKLLIAVLLMINAYLVVLPAVTSATDIASRSLAQGQVLSAYRAAYMKESIFGGVNVLLTIAAGVIGVWQIGGRSTGESKAPKDNIGGLT